MYRKLVANPAIGYILTRYITYGIQFINSILIAVYLGPVYLGVWGFIMLITQYLNQINFGIGNAVQTIAAVHNHRERYVSKIAGNGVVMLSCLSIMLAILFLSNYLFTWNFGDKYDFGTYSFFILLIAILTHFNSLLSNILRVYGKIWEMAISQSLLPFTTLCIVLVFRNEGLLMALVWAYTLTAFLSFVIFIIRIPIKIEINFDKRLWITIQRKGWHLFIYNSSFYLILISTRSFVSYYFTIRDFGFFTFAFSLANVLILLLDSFTFLVWPKLLNRLAKLNNKDSAVLIGTVRKLYLTCTHGMLHLGIFLFPFFLMMFPQYDQTHKAFCLIAMTIVLFTNSFGYQGLIIARGKEKAIGNLSLIILIINILLCYMLINWLHISYDLVIIATLISYALYIVLLNILGMKILGLQINYVNLLKEIFPVTLLIPFIASLTFILLDLRFYYYIIPLSLYLILNISAIKEMKSNLKKLMVNPRFFEI